MLNKLLFEFKLLQGISPKTAGQLQTLETESGLRHKPPNKNTTLELQQLLSPWELFWLEAPTSRACANAELWSNDMNQSATLLSL